MMGFQGSTKVGVEDGRRDWCKEFQSMEETLEKSLSIGGSDKEAGVQEVLGGAKLVF